MPVTPLITKAEKEFLKDLSLQVNLCFQDVGSVEMQHMLQLVHMESAHDQIALAYKSVIGVLYEEKSQIPPLNSLTLDFRRSMFVPAHANFDRDAKQATVCLNSSYFYSHYTRDFSLESSKYEFNGVLVHELTHVAQWNGTVNDPMPGGLIEGVADYVRLVVGYPAKHWKEVPTTVERNLKWDDGYSTTGYFLRWVESSLGKAFVHEVNLIARDSLWQESKCQLAIEEKFGRKIEEMWIEYQEQLCKTSSWELKN